MYVLLIFLSILGTTIPLQLHSSQASKAELAKIATINSLDEQLINAAANNQLEELQKLLKAGADINAKNEWGQTPLIMAVRNGHITIVEALIAAKADLNAQAKDDRTALMTAVSSPHMVIPNNRKKIILILLGAGADPSIKTDQQPPQSFLSMLAKGKYKELLQDIEIQKRINELKISEEQNLLHKEKNIKSEWIGGFCYTPHAFGQMKKRKIRLEDVRWILKYGKSCKDKYEPDCLKFYHPDKNIGIVIVEKSKTVKTVIKLKDSDALQWWLEKKQV